MRTVWAIGVVTALGATGCGGDSASVDVDADLSPDAGISTFRGTGATTYHLIGDTTTVPYSFADTEIEAFRWSDRGELHRYPGTGNTAGKFSIPDVPETRCTVRVGDFVHVATSHHELDVGDDFPGRPDWTPPFAGTTMLFNVDGMRSWSAADELGLYVPRLGFYNRFFELDAASELATGTTALVDWEVSWDLSPIIEGDEGDRAMLVRYVDQRETLGNDRLRKVAQVFEPAPFDQQNGGQTELAGAFENVPETETLHLEWQMSTFTAARLRIHPQASPPLFGSVGLYAQPGGVTPGWFVYGPYVFESTTFEPTTNLDYHEVSYGDPFPPEWPRFLVASTTQFAYLTDPYETFSVLAVADLIYAADLATYGEGPIALQVQPVTDMRIEGLPVHGYPGAVGTSPLLTWLAPLDATGYEVLLVHVWDAGGGEGDYDFVSLLFTAEPELRIPPGLLIEDEYYYVIVSAIYSPDNDISYAPFRRPMVYGRADAISGLFTP